MYKLKLVNAVHYSYGNKFVATIENPFVEVDKADADYLVSTECFEIIEEPKAEVKTKSKRTTKK